MALIGTPITKLYTGETSPAIWDHSVTCYPTQVNAVRSKPSPRAGTRFTNPGRAGRDGRLSLPGSATAGSLTRDLSITRPTPEPSKQVSKYAVYMQPVGADLRLKSVELA